MTLLIGIPAYNAKKYISDCLSSVLKDLAGLDAVVVVVNDGSTDETMAVLKRFTGSRIRVRDDNKNLGVSERNNELLIEAGRSDYFLRLDADTVVKPGAIKSLLEFLETHPKVGLVSAKVVTPDGRPSTSYFTYYQKPLTWFKEYNFLTTKMWRRLVARQGRAFPVKSLATTAVMARMLAVKKVGGFDENIPFFLEDSDWVKRFWDASYEVWVNPAAQVVHFGGSSDEETYIMCRDRSLASLYTFTAKHWPGKLNRTYLTVSIISGTVINLSIAILLLPLAINSRVRRILFKNFRSFGNVLRWYLKGSGAIYRSLIRES